MVRFCAECGRPLEGAARFCPGCGAKVPEGGRQGRPAQPQAQAPEQWAQDMRPEPQTTRQAPPPQQWQPPPYRPYAHQPQYAQPFPVKRKGRKPAVIGAIAALAVTAAIILMLATGMLGTSEWGGAGLEIYPAYVELPIGYAVILDYNDPNGGAVEWASGDPSVIGVTGDGKVTALAAGETHVTLRSGGSSVRCGFRVTDIYGDAMDDEGAGDYLTFWEVWDDGEPPPALDGEYGDDEVLNGLGRADDWLNVPITIDLSEIPAELLAAESGVPYVGMMRMGPQGGPKPTVDLGKAKVGKRKKGGYNWQIMVQSRYTWIWDSSWSVEVTDRVRISLVKQGGGTPEGKYVEKGYCLFTRVYNWEMKEHLPRMLCTDKPEIHDHAFGTAPWRLIGKLLEYNYRDYRGGGADRPIQLTLSERKDGFGLSMLHGSADLVVNAEVESVYQYNDRTADRADEDGRLPGRHEMRLQFAYEFRVEPTAGMVFMQCNKDDNGDIWHNNRYEYIGRLTKVLK